MKLSIIAIVLLAPALLIRAADDSTVALDGSGQYRSVQDAITAAPNRTKTWTIRIKPGVYEERIRIPKEKRFIRLIGDDPVTTVIRGAAFASQPGPDGKPLGTFGTATVLIEADDLIAENLTFENAAGPKGQALAVRLDGDRLVFRHCRFLGWQDTILGNRGRHYFDDCRIVGAVDFIFGGATEWFENCQIHCAGSGFITAASTSEEQPYGFVFSNCRISAEPGVKTYLGRPWRAHASVIFVVTEMPTQIAPEGWHNWDEPARENTARFAEFNSTGAGSASDRRVRWSRQLPATDVQAITIQKVIGGTDGFDPTITLKAPAAARER